MNYSLARQKNEKEIDMERAGSFHICYSLSYISKICHYGEAMVGDPKESADQVV